jgi:hypothetical protein
VFFFISLVYGSTHNSVVPDPCREFLFVGAASLPVEQQQKLLTGGDEQRFYGYLAVWPV